MTGRRVDVELVQRGLARSRRHASELIAAGRVHLDGRAVTKPSLTVSGEPQLAVAADESDCDYASRAAYKLIGALDALAQSGLSVQGCRCADLGASTGGFTDVLLRRGAKSVLAVDVGHGQILERLRTDDRVDVRERLNVRFMTREDIGGGVSLVVGDLSFISLRLVLPHLATILGPGTDVLALVKPQFEVGRQRLGANGVVRSPALQAEAVADVIMVAIGEGFGFRGIVASPLPGPSGNREYFVWLVAGASSDIAAAEIAELCQQAVSWPVPVHDVQTVVPAFVPKNAAAHVVVANNLSSEGDP